MSSSVEIKFISAASDGVGPALLLTIPRGRTATPAQYLVNAPEGFARLVLEHRCRPGAGLRALLLTSLTPSAQGGLAGLLLRLRQDGHAALRVVGPAGLHDVVSGLAAFVRCTHPALTLSPLTAAQQGPVHEDECIEVRPLWSSFLLWQVPDWLSAGGVDGGCDGDAGAAAAEAAAASSESTSSADTSSSEGSPVSGSSSGPEQQKQEQQKQGAESDGGGGVGQELLAKGAALLAAAAGAPPASGRSKGQATGGGQSTGGGDSGNTAQPQPAAQAARAVRDVNGAMGTTAAVACVQDGGGLGDSVEEQEEAGLTRPLKRQRGATAGTLPKSQSPGAAPGAAATTQAEAAAAAVAAAVAPASGGAAEEATAVDRLAALRGSILRTRAAAAALLSAAGKSVQHSKAAKAAGKAAAAPVTDSSDSTGGAPVGGAGASAWTTSAVSSQSSDEDADDADVAASGDNAAKGSRGGDAGAGVGGGDVQYRGLNFTLAPSGVVGAGDATAAAAAAGRDGGEAAGAPTAGGCGVWVPPGCIPPVHVSQSATGLGRKLKFADSSDEEREQAEAEADGGAAGGRARSAAAANGHAVKGRMGDKDTSGGSSTSSSSSEDDTSSSSSISGSGSGSGTEGEARGAAAQLGKRARGGAAAAPAAVQALPRPPAGSKEDLFSQLDNLFMARAGFGAAGAGAAATAAAAVPGAARGRGGRSGRGRGGRAGRGNAEVAVAAAAATGGAPAARPVLHTKRAGGGGAHAAPGPMDAALRAQVLAQLTKAAAAPAALTGSGGPGAKVAAPARGATALVAHVAATVLAHPTSILAGVPRGRVARDAATAAANASGRAAAAAAAAGAQGPGHGATSGFRQGAALTQPPLGYLIYLKPTRQVLLLATPQDAAGVDALAAHPAVALLAAAQPGLLMAVVHLTAPPLARRQQYKSFVRQVPGPHVWTNGGGHAAGGGSDGAEPVRLGARAATRNGTSASGAGAAADEEPGHLKLPGAGSKAGVSGSKAGGGPLLGLGHLGSCRVSMRLNAVAPALFPLPFVLRKQSIGSSTSSGSGATGHAGSGSSNTKATTCAGGKGVAEPLGTGDGGAAVAGGAPSDTDASGTVLFEIASAIAGTTAAASAADKTEPETGADASTASRVAKAEALAAPRKLPRHLHASLLSRLTASVFSPAAATKGGVGGGSSVGGKAPQAPRVQLSWSHGTLGDANGGAGREALADAWGAGGAGSAAAPSVGVVGVAEATAVAAALPCAAALQAAMLAERSGSGLQQMLAALHAAFPRLASAAEARRLLAPPPLHLMLHRFKQHQHQQPREPGNQAQQQQQQQQQQQSHYQHHQTYQQQPQQLQQQQQPHPDLHGPPPYFNGHGPATVPEHTTWHQQQPLQHQPPQSYQPPYGDYGGGSSSPMQYGCSAEAELTAAAAAYGPAEYVGAVMRPEWSYGRPPPPPVPLQLPPYAPQPYGQQQQQPPYQGTGAAPPPYGWQQGWQQGPPPAPPQAGQQQGWLVQGVPPPPYGHPGGYHSTAAMGPGGHHGPWQPPAGPYPPGHPLPEPAPGDSVAGAAASPSVPNRQVAAELREALRRKAAAAVSAAAPTATAEAVAPAGPTASQSAAGAPQDGKLAHSGGDGDIADNRLAARFVRQRLKADGLDGVPAAAAAAVLLPGQTATADAGPEGGAAAAGDANRSRAQQLRSAMRKGEATLLGAVAPPLGATSSLATAPQPEGAVPSPTPSDSQAQTAHRDLTAQAPLTETARAEAEGVLGEAATEALATEEAAAALAAYRAQLTGRAVADPSASVTATAPGAAAGTAAAAAPHRGTQGCEGSGPADDAQVPPYLRHLATAAAGAAAGATAGAAAPAVGDVSVMFLGTGSAEPSKYRGASAVLLRGLRRGGTNTSSSGQEPAGSAEGYGGGVGGGGGGGGAGISKAAGSIGGASSTGAVLIDAGEGTYGALVRWLGPKGAVAQVAALSLVWLSHKHPDHILGLPALLEARPPEAPPLLVVGPQEVAEWLSKIAHLHPHWHFTFVHCAHFAGSGPAPGGQEPQPLSHPQGLAPPSQPTWHAPQQQQQQQPADALFSAPQGLIATQARRGGRGGGRGAAGRGDPGPGPGNGNDGDQGAAPWGPAGGGGGWPSPEWRSGGGGADAAWEVAQGRAAAAAVCGSLGLVRWQSVAVHHCRDAWGLVLEHADGWKLVYSGDTRPCPALVAAGRGATLLIHEATFEPCLEQQARGKRHSTSAEAAAVAAAMGAYRTVLTHFSQRYPRVPGGIDAWALPLRCRPAIAFDGMLLPLAALPQLPHVMPPLALALGEPPAAAVGAKAAAVGAMEVQEEMQVQDDE
ncbi:hypothetical protein HYH02_007695 [Chlamydomonas schloesseri]|uniref:ribonuclease Z n=1 Tax=Chlamydomonas schloesseri TaxID=2026947 RepID=A0A836B4I1_9CHLO|nr:hypothetical protein HYH02_007695 [Chlamydomonas schloesseri]|eukprot:KAG2447367.1 hypothetical protein HYH02_007695 [Chlamydomonas schloesseri]